MGRRRKKKNNVKDQGDSPLPFDRYISKERWLDIIGKCLVTFIWIKEIQLIVIEFLYWYKHELHDPTYDERLNDYEIKMYDVFGSESPYKSVIPYLAVGRYPVSKTCPTFTIYVERDYGELFTLVGLISASNSRVYAIPPIEFFNDILIDVEIDKNAGFQYTNIVVHAADASGGRAIVPLTSPAFTDDVSRYTLNEEKTVDTSKSCAINIHVDLTERSISLGFKHLGFKHIFQRTRFINVPHIADLHPFVYCNRWKPDHIAIQQ